MTHRKIRGDDGHDWEIWDVIPSTVARPEPQRLAHLALPPALRDGWLAFQCENESRRLAPIPVAWNQLSDAQLCRLISEADVIPLRPGRQREDKSVRL